MTIARLSLVLLVLVGPVSAQKQRKPMDCRPYPKTYRVELVNRTTETRELWMVELKPRGEFYQWVSIAPGAGVELCVPNGFRLQWTPPLEGDPKR